MQLPASRTGRLVLCGICTALALALSLLDSAVSSVFAFLPGFRLGLANAVSLFVLYYLGMPWACLVCVVRCALASVFSGQVTAFLFSIFGGFGSLCIMFLLRGRISLIKVSISGGITHNMMQLAAAALVTATPSLAWYIPPLIGSGTLTGLLLGALCRLIFERLHLRPVFDGTKTQNKEKSRVRTA